ncbi:MAG: hypothetical protein IPM54_29810 [Polyangiaceae bacterium]|nr:hypothetical protein [Polyangiaceae bacterium]
MTRELTGFQAIGLLLAAFVLGGACTPTDRDFASGGAGGQGGGCPTGFAECDGDPTTECETDTTTLEHCGACDNACAAAPNANVACEGGKCSIPSCTDGRENCDNFYENGCETNPSVSFEHCGACGNSCEAPQAITACVTGTCQLAQCVLDYLDCDMDPKTGCEVDPKADAEHCGGCGNTCMAPNANMACAESQCMIASCMDNFGDCNGNLADGCETDLTTHPDHCGMCGNSCQGGLCNSGICNPPVLVSKAGFPAGELAIYNDELYIGSRSGAGEVAKVKLAGGSTFIMNTTGAAANAIFVSDAGVFVGGGNVMARMNHDGSNMFMYSGMNGTVRGVAADLKNVYWSSLSNIRFGPVAGGISNTFVSTPTSAYGVAIHKDYLYWSLSDGSIWRSPVDTPKPDQISLGPTVPTNMVVDASNAYWNSYNGMHWAPHLGGSAKTIAPATSAVRALAVDDTYVYWTEESMGEIRKARKDGSEPFVTIYKGPPGPWGIAVDAQFVYWSNYQSMEIWKVLR